MAGTWGKWHGSWERPGASSAPHPPAAGMSLDEDEDDHEDGEADEGDPAEWAKWLSERDFTLVREGETTSEEGGYASLVMEVDDRPAVLAFTSLKYANLFAGEQPELFDDAQNIQGFVVEGRIVVQETPADVAILIDAGSDDERYLSPELLDRIREELKRE